MKNRLRLIWFALLGRPILHGVTLRGPVTILTNEPMLIEANTFDVGTMFVGPEPPTCP